MTKKAGLLFAIAMLISPTSFPSYAIYVGKNLTEDGSVFIGGSGDEVSSCVQGRRSIYAK